MSWILSAARDSCKIRPVIQRAALVLLLASSATALWLFYRPDPRPTRLIVVTADTLRADRLSCYGSPNVKTPHLDALAEEGVLFENATTVTPLTLPAHASIFTGTYPMHHGVRDNGGYYLEPSEVTLAETLKDKGFATGAFVGAFVLDSRWGLDQGFDRYFDDFDLSKYERISLDTVQRRGDEVMAEALAWMDSVKDKPFFCWIHLYDAHAPYDPPEPYRSTYDGRPWGLYDGEVAFVDSLMGKLESWLDRKGLERETVVAFVGDHGESLGQHGEVTHGFFVYDATVHVPFIVKAPRRALRGRRIPAQVRTIDLMPTVLELLGIENPASVQGKSLTPVATGETEDLGLLAYSESFYPRHHYGWSEVKSLRGRTWQFIDAPRPELFELASDPFEQKDLAPESPGRVRQLTSELEEVARRYSATGVETKGPAALDAETQERLAALGYLGGPSKVKLDPLRPLADPKDKIHLFNLIKQAGSASSEGRVDEALTRIESVLAEDPDILEAHDIRGNLFKKKGDVARAIEAYREALSRDPEYKPALFNLALAYKDTGRTAEAAVGLERILTLDPRDNKAYFVLAEIHVGKKEFQKALDLLKRSAERGTERAPAHNLMAECYVELKDFAAAEREVRTALALKPDLPIAHFNLAIIREERGDREGAVAAYEKEIEVAPKSYKAHFNLAKLLDGERQVEHLKKAVELKTDFANGYLYLAKAYLDGGRLEEAVEEARRGIELGADRNLAPLGHFILVDVYNRMGRYRDAERELAIARRLQGG